MANGKKVKIAAIGDLHMHEKTIDTYKSLFSQIADHANILVLCGDLTDHGHTEEASFLVDELKVCKIPVVGVLGNHDYENGKENEIKKILSSSMTILGEEPCEIMDIGFAGTKGFGGGFGSHALGPFGEDMIKKFVYEAVNESLALENSLAKLETEKKVVVLHYSPVIDTVIGESEEIFPFLGSSRLSEPIDSFNVTAVFHGHAHHGAPLGKTIKGIPVYNASQFVQKRAQENPYVVIDL